MASPKFLLGLKESPSRELASETVGKEMDAKATAVPLLRGEELSQLLHVLFDLSKRSTRKIHSIREGTIRSSHQ